MTAAVLTPVLTVGLVGDHPVSLLSGVDGLRIVVCTADGAGAATPDVLIVDGVPTLRAVRDRVPGVPVLVVTAADDVESVFNAMRAGARGYLLRGAERTDIVRAVRGIAAGEMILGAQIAGRLTDLMIRQTQPSHPFPTLSAREREIMELIAVGANNSTIARRLDLAPKTVRNNVCTIFGKLGIADRADAMARARAAGLPRAS